MALTIEVGINILHPNLQDLEDSQRIQAANAQVFHGAATAFANHAENRYPAAGGPDHGEMIFRRVVEDNSNAVIRPVIHSLCQRFFNQDDYYCFDSIRRGQDVLFRPAQATGGQRVAKFFGSRFALEMAQGCEAAPTFASIHTQARNVFSGEQMLWFRASMNTVLSVTDCENWLHDLTEALPSTAWSSNDPVANRFTSHAPSLLEIAKRRSEIALGIIRRCVTRSDIDSYYLIRTDLEGGELQQATNDTTDTLELTVARLHYEIDELRYMYSQGRHAPDQVARVLQTLDCCNNQRGQLYALTNKEAPSHRAARNKWAAGAVIIGIATIAVVCWPLAAAVSLSASAATAIGVAGLTGSFATAKCFEKAYLSHIDSKIPEVVHKLRNTMLSLRTFLYIAEWRSHGLEDDDDKLIQFAERMAEMFNINNVLENWNDPAYKEQYVGGDWTSMRRNIHEFMTRVRSRRQPHKERAGGRNHGIPQAYIAHHFQHDHTFNFPTGDEFEFPDPENFAIEGSNDSMSDSVTLSMTSGAETWDLYSVFGDSTDTED